MTTPLQLSSLGERMNLLLQQGATFGPIVATMTNPDLSPVNLTGCTIFGSVRKTAASTTIDAIPDGLQRGLMQDEWDDSQQFERQRPSLLALAGAIGLAPAQVDALFLQASKL